MALRRSLAFNFLAILLENREISSIALIDHGEDTRTFPPPVPQLQRN
jgi:hypothetical protein